MANDCLFWLRVVSPKKASIRRLEKIMRYEDKEKFMYRVREIESSHPIVKINNLYVADYEGIVAWSDLHWFEPYQPMPGEKQKQPEIFPKLCPELDIAVESWTEELGIGFQGHTACDRHGKFLVDETKDYAVTMSGKPKKGMKGFGWKFRECFQPEFLYHGLDYMAEKT